MRTFTLLINGEQLPGAMTMPVYNPATGAVVTQAPRASRTQLDLAVAAAKAAFPGWAATGIDARKRALQSIAEIVAENARELA
jgi:acyl-CoA reductase-like NAD-dependent aldehyde dehydrogenase